MTPLRPLTLAAALAFASPLTLPAASAQAQPSAPAAEEHELEIRDGRLFLDGRALPAKSLPNGLDLTGIEMTYSYAGPVVPVIEIDGVVYVLEGDRLQVLAETDRATEQVYFMPVAPPAAEVAAEAAALDGVRATHEEAAVREREAGEEAYLRQVSARDRALYEQIREEQTLESETLRLADQIRRTPDASARARLIQSLREKLDASFELKQEIRADEIEQAEGQIEELRRLLRERAARKEQIIERRMDELIGDGP